MKLLLFIIVFIISFACQAGPGSFPQGDHVKLLKDKLEFKNTLTQIISNDTDDPGSVAKSAAISSLYLREGTVGAYIKTDAGSSTNWDAILTETLADLLYYPQGDFINSSAGAGDAGKPIVLDADGDIDATMINGGDIDHGSLAGRADDDHSGYLWGLGRSGSQTLNGGTDACDDLTLSSTTNATKGTIFFGANSAYDQANDRLGVGTTTPGSIIDVVSTTLSSLPYPAMTETQRDAIGTPATGSSVYNTTDNSLNTYNGSTWDKLLDQKYDINYILNFHAEKDTTGWATYADTPPAPPADILPVDGTGGSPTVTWTRSTSTPLRETASFLLTKDTADRQGEGASYDFTISNTDQAKALSITFDVSTSANYVDNDMIVYIYDVTNASLIEPAPRDILAGTNGRFTTQFQSAPDSTSYRLIFHVSTDSADAYTVKFDNIKVGPSKIVFAAPLTDWKEFTPTGTFTSNITYEGFKRRVGDSVEVMIRMSFSGAPNSVSADINLSEIVDVSLFPGLGTSTLDPMGQIQLYEAGVGSYPGSLKLTSSTTARLQYFDGAGKIITVTQAAPFTIGNNDEIRMLFKYPVSGWSSNVQMSDDTDNRIIAAKYNTNAGQTIAHDSEVTIVYEDKIFDTHNAMNTTTGVYSVPESGYYEVNACGRLSTYSNLTRVRLYLDGSTKTYLTDVVNPTRYNYCGSDTVYRDKGGTIYIDIRQANSGSSTKTIDSDASGTYVSIHKVQGPSSIMANESIHVRAYNTSTQSINSASEATVIFGAKANDSHDAYDTSTGIFTAPVGGFYVTSSQLLYDTTATWNDGEQAYIGIVYNGSNISNPTTYPPTNATGQRVNISSSVGGYLNKGETIYTKTYQNSGAALNLRATGSQCNMTIHRVGF